MGAKTRFPHLTPDTRFKLLSVDRFNFDTLKETFGTDINIAVAFGAHAALNLMLGKLRLVTRGTVLTASTRVDNYVFGDFAFP